MTKKTDLYSLFAYFALALGFLSAIADRLGIWTLLLGNLQRKQSEVLQHESVKSSHIE